MNLRDVLLVASGGAAGAVARYGANLLCAEIFGHRFPWGTFAVNVLGCFLLGVLVQTATLSTVSDATKLAVGTGFLGAFTTFSTFSVETILVWNRSPVIALANVVASVLVGLIAAIAGIYLSTRLSGMQS